MEQRIIDTLQQCVDGWKEAIDNEWNAFARFYQEKWNQVAPFAEEVLGKNVSIKNWKVVVISK